MHLGFKVKLGIFHLKSDSPAERRRKRARRQKRIDTRRKRRQMRRQRFRKWIERRATTRWNQRVREPVVASTRPRAVRDDARDQRRAARVTAARADAARVTQGAPGAAGGWQRPPGYVPQTDQWSAEVAAGRMSMVAAERRRHLGVEEAERIEAEERDKRRARRAAGPQNAHGQTLPTEEGGWPTDTQAWAAGSPEHLAELNARGAASREARAQQLRAAGLCGHPTQKDRSPCLNHAGSCPHHRGMVRA